MDEHAAFCGEAYKVYAARVEWYRKAWRRSFTPAELRLTFPLPSFGEFLEKWRCSHDFRTQYAIPVSD